jgi:hypothetical protein
MPDKNAASPQSQRDSIFEELKILDRLINRLLVRATTQAGDGPVGERIEEILLVNRRMATHLAQLEALESQADDR